MAFNNIFPEWVNKGTEPSEDLKNIGYQKGDLPPASTFNWFWAKTMDAITELQEKVEALENSGGTLLVTITKQSASSGMNWDLYINDSIVKSISNLVGTDGGTFLYENVTSAYLKLTSGGSGGVVVNGVQIWDAETPDGTTYELPTSGAVEILSPWMN